MALPRLAYVAEIAWSAPACRDFADINRRMAIQKERYAAMGVNYRHGYTETILGTVASSGDMIGTHTFDVSDIVIGSGHYLVRINGGKQSHGSEWSRVDLLENGRVIKSIKNPTLTGSAGKRAVYITDYIIPLESYKPDARYQLRLVNGVGSGSFTVTAAKVQPEGFGPVDD